VRISGNIITAKEMDERGDASWVLVLLLQEAVVVML
jgi:hypothetical protein